MYSSDRATNSCPHYACYVQPNFASRNNNTDVVMSLPDSSFPLAQCTGLVAGEPFEEVVKFSVIDACFK